MIDQNLLIGGTAVTVAITLLITLYLLFGTKKRGVKNVFLSLLFLAISLRVLKSFLYFLLPKTSLLAISTGVVGGYLIGPLAYFYFRTPVVNQKGKGLKWKDLIHLVIPVLALTLLMRYGLVSQLYFSAGLSAFFYIGLCYYLLLKKNRPQESKNLSKWNRWLLLSLIGIAMAMSAPALLPGVISYALSITVICIIVFIQCFLFLKYSPTLSKKRGVINQLDEDYQRKIIEALEKQEAYKQPSITLSEFSRQLEIPQYVISKVTKSVYRKSFPETVNSLRIEEIKKQLAEEDGREFKVEQLAFDAGFNTLSTFYAAFKRETSMSPREYQKHIDSGLK